MLKLPVAIPVTCIIIVASCNTDHVCDCLTTCAQGRLVQLHLKHLVLQRMHKNEWHGWDCMSAQNCPQIVICNVMQDGSSFSIRVINSNGDTVIFPNDYWGQSWLCIEQAVLKYANCPGSWSVQIACDNAFAACTLIGLRHCD